MPQVVKTEQVFGIRIEPVLSYLERGRVDGVFEDALESDHHIIVYGSSKQGKTALRQKHLDEKKECAVVRPSLGMSIEGIYQAALRCAGIRIETVETVRDELSLVQKAKVGLKAVYEWGGEAKTSRQMELRSEYVGYSFAEAQSVGELLGRVGFEKYIVLENFHYLSTEVQRRLAFDLKTFHEIGVRFIILGVWREANRLLQFNNDLQDRIVEVPVEPWSADDLHLVAQKGSDLLNVGMSGPIVESLIENAYGNVGLFQEFLKGVCRHCGVAERQGVRKELVAMQAVTRTFQEKIADQRNTLLQTLIHISSRSRARDDTDDPLILPYYLIKIILRASIQQLADGIDKKVLLERIRAIHHRENKATIRVGDVTNLLSRLPSLQADLQPPFLYFDGNSNRLKIVDTRQFFVLANVDRVEMEEEIPNPLDS